MKQRVLCTALLLCLATSGLWGLNLHQSLTWSGGSLLERTGIGLLHNRLAFFFSTPLAGDAPAPTALDALYQQAGVSFAWGGHLRFQFARGGYWSLGLQMNLGWRMLAADNTEQADDILLDDSEQGTRSRYGLWLTVHPGWKRHSATFSGETGLLAQYSLGLSLLLDNPGFSLQVRFDPVWYDKPMSVVKDFLAKEGVLGIFLISDTLLSEVIGLPVALLGSEGRIRLSNSLGLTLGLKLQWLALVQPLYRAAYCGASILTGTTMFTVQYVFSYLYAADHGISIGVVFSL